jgi:hypothetical protein
LTLSFQNSTFTKSAAIIILKYKGMVDILCFSWFGYSVAGNAEIRGVYILQSVNRQWAIVVDLAIN